MTSDLSQLRELYHKAVEAFIQGDPGAHKQLWSERDDVTLANPLGPPVRGADRVHEAFDRASAQVSEGEGYVFEIISLVETTDLAYEVGIERNRVKLGDAVEKVSIVLRTTTIFRREEGEWKVVHRHADSIAEERSIRSIVHS
jgi:ketosteroid isomerase-like protein